MTAALAERNRIWSRSASSEYRVPTGNGAIIDLAQGYLTEPPPPHIVAAAQAALDAGETHYVDHAGLEPLRVALAAHLSPVGKPALEPSEILVTSGAQEALFVALRALVRPGDEVLVPDLGYSPMEAVVELAGGTVVRVPDADGLRYSAANLAARVSPAARFVVLVSPNSATGRVIAPDEYAAVLQIAEQHGLTVLLDAALEQGIYEPIGRPSPVDSDRLILIGSASKFYRMSGWRIGWIAARAEYIKPLKTFKQLLSICSASISQWAALAALTGPQDWLAEQTSELARRRDVVLEMLSVLQFPVIPPDAAPFVLFDIRRTDLTSTQFAERALTQASVVMTPGNAFGPAGEGYMRLALVQPEATLRVALDRLAALTPDVQP